MTVDVGDAGSVRFLIGDHNIQLTAKEFASIKPELQILSTHYDDSEYSDFCG